MSLSWIPITFGVAALVAAVATPAVARLAVVLGVIDRPNERKVSTRGSMPLLGGLGIGLGFFIGISVALLLLPEESLLGKRLDGLIGGSLIVLAVGALDDRWGLSALPKLIVQIVAASVAISSGFEIDHLSSPISHDAFYFPRWLVWVVTTVWIVIVTNSLNLIDGLDGLCTGVSAIIATTLTVIAWQGGHIPGVVIGIALVGALLGFLPYNFPPARIFVGDTGALFIGFCLSLLALEGYQRVTVITFLVPLLAFAVPLLDTGLSIARRLRAGANPMRADKLHLHHRLLSEYDGSHRPAVLSIYFLTACFCVIAVSFTRLQGSITVIFLLVIGVLTLRILRNLGFFYDEPAAAGSEGGEDSQ